MSTLYQGKSGRGPHSNTLTRILAALALFFAPSVHAGSQQTYLDALVDFERYAETIWHDATGVNQPTNSGYWGDGGSSGNGGIRG